MGKSLVMEANGNRIPEFSELGKRQNYSLK
jgi:hypothetical protein